MRFKLDENLPLEAAVQLQQTGHEALTAFDQNLAGVGDQTLYAVCQREQRILLTLDQGFADIRLYPPGEHPGIIVFRLRRQDKRSIEHAVSRAVRTLSSEQVDGRLWIVDDTRIRSR